MSSFALSFLVVGVLWVSVFKVWAATIMFREEPDYGPLLLFPPFSIIALFSHWDRLWVPTLLGMPGAVMALWGFLLLVL
jgi:hypothetical protein